MAGEETNISLSLPGEWALQKTLGPTLDVVGVDLSKLYTSTKAGMAKIAMAAKSKLSSKELKDDSPKLTANLRVVRDVFWNGSFSNDDICAEYFGGVLAQSRSKDGQDDHGIYYLDIIKSLSSSQLKLHFLIYRGLNYLLVNNVITDYSTTEGTIIDRHPVYIRGHELRDNGIDINIDIPALYHKGVIGNYRYDSKMHPEGVYTLKVTPSSLGMQLFAVASNELDQWRKFHEILFNNFQYEGAFEQITFDITSLRK